MWKVKTKYALLLCLLSGCQLAMAGEADIEAKLEQMNQLLLQQQQDLLQQQQEIKAQQEELAEQRALILQLQRSLGQVMTTPGSPAPAEPTGHTAMAQATEAGTPDKDHAPPGDGQQDSSVMDDPSNTTYDPGFPGAWHLPGTTTAMKVGGYVNLSIVNSFDPLLIPDRFIVGSIPPKGQNVSGASSGTEVSASQTRLNFEFREQTRRGEVRAFLEGDFQGDGDTFRLRHAFGQFNWALGGKTWSTLMDIDSRPEEVDVEGINGEILIRNSQVRIFPQIGKKFKFKIALEDPSTDVINGQSERGRADLVASFGYMPLGPFGRWNSRLGLIVRDLQASETNFDPENTQSRQDSATGWGLTTGGRKPLAWWGEKDFLLWQITYGKGIGHYINDLGSIGGGDAVFDPAGKLHALPVFAGYVSYQHQWPLDMWFLKSWPGILRSNATLSWVNIDNFNFQDDGDYASTLRASINLIYVPAHDVTIGTELLWGERKNKGGSKGTATQLQVSLRYSF